MDLEDGSSGHIEVKDNEYGFIADLRPDGAVKYASSDYQDVRIEMRCDALGPGD